MSSAHDASAENGNGEQTEGWLDRLLGRFGLTEQPDLRTLIQKLLARDGDDDPGVSEHERTMLRNILEFGSLRVEDVMVPRTDIMAIEDRETIGAALARFAEVGHSRLPIYRGSLDDPRGMVHIKDLIPWLVSQARNEAENGAGAASLDLARLDLSRSLADIGIAREILYVPAAMSALDLLLRMQTTRSHIALVIDEYGGVDGLVTLDDLIEEVMGEIEDEHDAEDDPWILDDPKQGLVVDARTSLEDLEEVLSLPLNEPDEDDVESIGGFVVALLGHVPVKGEIVGHKSGVEFEILEADARRIKRIRVHRPAAVRARAARTARPASSAE